jgi:hypothetical protein
MEVQGNERIRNVIVDDPPWVPNRRRRKGIFRQQPYERLERATCPFGEPESRRQGLDLRGNRTWQL